MIHVSTFCWATNVPNYCWTEESCVVECWNMPFNTLNGSWTLLNRIELESIPFNKLPLVERRPPIVFEFIVTQLGGKIQHGDWNCGCIGMELWECVIWVKRPTRLRTGFWALPRECSMPRKRSCSLAILESTFSDFFSTFHNYSDKWTLAAQSGNNISSSTISKFAPKCAHVAQHKLNEYSTSPTLVQHLLSNECWTVYHWF